jgi:peptidoglycan/xylan/chitin deacetylase (PgdA/CDA1 family)
MTRRVHVMAGLYVDTPPPARHDEPMRRVGMATVVGALLLVVSSGPASAMPSVASAPSAAASTGSCLAHLPTRDKVVALTFDMGGGAGGLHRILDTLESESVPATFFATGNWARMFPHRLRKIARRGYAIGNHSNTHPDMTHLSDAQVEAQLRTAARAIRRATGSNPGPWFRFPFGTHSVHDVELVNDLGYACIQWTVDTAGWMGTSGGASVDSVLRRVLDGARRGEIVLMHAGANPKDGSTLDADALPAIIRRLRDLGYGFVALDSPTDPAA